MSILTKYIMKTVMLSVLGVVLLLSALYVIFTFIAQTGDIGKGSYDSLSAILYVVMTLPTNIVLFLPVAGLLGTLIGLGLLATNSELMVMRAAGVSIRKIGVGVFWASVVMMVITFVLSAYVAPELQKMGDMRRSMAMNQQDFLWQSKSFWLKDGPNFVHVGGRDRHGHLQDVVKYDVDNSRLVSVTSAPEAVYKNNEWVLNDASVTHINKKQITVDEHQSVSWPSLVAPILLNVASTNPRNLNALGLLTLIQYQKANGLDATEYEFKAWRLLFQPLSVMVLMLLAIPFVFGPLRSSVMGWQIMTGLIFGLGFFFVDRFFGPFSEVYHIPPIVGAALPSILVLFVLLVLSLRMG